MERILRGEPPRVRNKRLQDERAKQVNSQRRQRFGREEKSCRIWRLGGRAEGRLQTSRSPSTRVGREKDRGSTKLLGR